MLREIIMYSIIAVFIGISQSAGVGGGPVLNICLMIGGHYSAKESMAITYIFLMGGACASIIKNYKKLYKNTHKFVMDYNLIMITLPMIASGSLFGTLTNHFLSQMVITILFVVLLTYLAINTYQKIQKLSTTNSTCSKNLLNQALVNSKQYKQEQQNETNKRQLQQILSLELNPLPRDKLTVIFVVFLYTLATLLIKGGHNFNSIIGLQRCSLAGDILIFIHLGLGYFFSRKIGLQANKNDNRKQSLGYKFQCQSDKMTQQKIKNSIISGFFAGLIGGTLGLGGAIVLVPVWLSSGIDQQRATGSSPPLIFFSALISFTICLLSGHYKSFMQLCFYFGLAYLGSALVKSIINIITQKFQLQIMVMLLLQITIVLSLITLLPYQIYKFTQNPSQFLKFGQFC